jgi:hypothetical protein
MKMLTTAELMRLTGCPPGTIDRLRGTGSLVPAVVGGRGAGDRWSMVQCLALAVARGVRRLGVCLADAEAVRLALWDMSQEALEARIADGRRFVMIAGDKALPRLTPRYDSLAELGIDVTAAQASSPLLTLTPRAVDVAEVWGRLLAATTQPDAAHAAAPK